MNRKISMLPLFNKQPCIRALSSVAMDALATLVSETTDQTWEDMFDEVWKDDYDEDNDVDIDEELRTEMLTRLKQYINLFVPAPIHHELLSYLDYGRFSHESIADRFYMDAPLFPEDESGNYLWLRNVMDVLTMLVFQHDNNESIRALYPMLQPHYSMNACRSRLQHRAAELFMWSVASKQIEDMDYFRKFLAWNQIEPFDFFEGEPQNLLPTTLYRQCTSEDESFFYLPWSNR